MATQIQCTHCGQTYDLTPEQAPQYAGQTITCTKCQKPFTVPANLVSGAASAPPAAQRPGIPPAFPQAQVQTQYTMPAAGSQTNGMAIAALICGILGCTGIGGILAIIFGILGIQKAKDPRVGGKGMAIAGIILGAMLMLSPCMISILLPSLNRAREAANRVKCQANMRQIGQALLLYGNENRGALPPTLELALATQEISPDVFTCPSTNDTPAPGADGKTHAANLSKPGHLSYRYFGSGMKTSAGADVVILVEPITNHSGDGCNVLFGDGHVEWISKPQAQRVISQVEAGQNPPKFGTGQ